MGETSEFITASVTFSVQNATESIPSTFATEIVTVSESELSTINITQSSSPVSLSSELASESGSSASPALNSESSTGIVTITESEVYPSITISETGTNIASETSSITEIETGSFTTFTETPIEILTTLPSSTLITSTSSYQAPTWFFLYFDYLSNGSSTGRSFSINSPRSSNIENEVK